MTTIALSQLVHRAPAFFQRISSAIRRLFRRNRRGPPDGAALQALSQMTDAQLAARGLKREDIPQAVLDYRVRILCATEPGMRQWPP